MSGAAPFLPLERPAALVPLVLGSASVASLLLYFYGVASMGAATRWLLLPAIVALAAFLLWARRGDPELAERVIAGLWAGALATLAYDLVRLPVSAAGVPVFKAISYFGTLILDRPAPTLATELAGWGYHLTNGVGFGLMYAAAFRRAGLWTALAWGVALEIVMLLTPYAEIFGYRVTPRFMAITVGAHLVYGAVLWAALVLWRRLRGSRRRAAKLSGLALLAPLGIGLVAAEFHQRHAASIPPSPPAYVGEHLYVTWNVLEPDRIAVLWLARRHLDPAARFHFIEPFSGFDFGRAIDIPEAETRRSGTRSATEVLLAELDLLGDEKLRLLAETTHLYEIAPWRLPSNPAALALGADLMEAVGSCQPRDVAPCLDRGLRFLDRWYGE